MNYKKIIYLYKSRIPTEKANGYQTFKTCEAFINKNKKVEIWTPTRYNFKSIKNQNLSIYYNLNKIPRIKRLPSIDIINLFNLIKIDKFLNKYKKFSSILLLISFAFATILKIIFSYENRSIFYTRDINLAKIIIFFIPKIKSRMFLEIHSLSENKNNFKKQINTIKKVKGIVTLTHYMKKELENNGICDYKIICAHDAVEREIFKIKLDKYSARKKLKLPQDKFIIMYIGKFYTLGKEKGIPQIIESIKYLKIENFIFYLIGGPLSGIDKYKKIINDYKINPKKIIFLDHQEKNKIGFWQRSADVLLMTFPKTNHYAKYASPLKLFEYMCSKNPIIATDLISTKEILTHKKNSILVKPNSPKAIADGINMISENKDLSNKISKNAYKEVDNYSWEIRAEKILNLISRLKE